MSVAITEAITSLAQIEQAFGLTRTEDENFFQEWSKDLPALTHTNKDDLSAMRRRYLYQRSEGHLLEGTITLLFASPLLTIAGFYDPPFKVRAEESISLKIVDSQEVLRGRLDVLVLKETFWVVVLESKKTALSIWSALPQTLAYLMANPNSDDPSFALMTNGDDTVFVKLTRSGNPKYNVSRIFSALVADSELFSTLQILKHMGQIIGDRTNAAS